MAKQVRPWLTKPDTNHELKVRPSDEASTSGFHQGQRKQRSLTQRPDVWLQSLPANYHCETAWQTGERPCMVRRQTFARHLELRSGRPETANRVFGSYVRHHDRDWRTEASFAVRRTPSRAQILGIPLVARALHRLLEHIAQPMPRRIFTIRGVLIPY